MKPIRIAFVGKPEDFEQYRKTLSRFDNVEFKGAFLTSSDAYSYKSFSSVGELSKEVDAVFVFGSTIRKKYLQEIIKTIKHVFIDDYTVLMNEDIYEYKKLSEEAGGITQISFPKVYYWGIQNLVEEYSKIRNIFFFREYIYYQSKQGLDLIPEVLSSIKLINQEVVRVQSKRTPLLDRHTEIQSLTLDFKTGATASIVGIPVGFEDVHSLRIIAERNLAYVDLRRREWHSLKSSKKQTKNPIKGLAGLPEIGDIEYFEVQDFLSSIEDTNEPFVTMNDIVALYNCLKLTEEQ